MQTALDAKQDTISDLDAIRSGAALGSTSVQPAGLDNYLEKDTFKPINWSYPDPNDNSHINKLTLEKDDKSAYRLTLNKDLGNETYNYNYNTTISASDIIISDTVATQMTRIAPNYIKLGDSFGYSFVTFDYSRMQIQGSASKYIYYEDIVTKNQLPTKTSQLTNDSGYLVNADLPLVTYSNSAISGGTELKSIQVGEDKWNIPTSVKSVTPSEETWTFTLSDGSTVTKTIVTGITVA